MLERVVNPQQGKVTFGYDALGRRVYKEVKHTRTCWLWDGNTPLHEWQTTEKEPLIDMVTWVFEEGTFVPTARITDSGSQSILTDYLGTPTQMYDEQGQVVWEARLDIYGKVRTFAGRSLSDCPFRYQGQYQDSETGLYYNRFRYIFSTKHIKSGIMSLGENRKDISRSIVKKLRKVDSDGLLKQGHNQIKTTINGQQAEIRVFIKEGKAMSIDCFKGHSSRNMGNMIIY